MVAPKLQFALGNIGKWIDTLAPAFCIGYFLLLAGGGLQSGFTGDDAMNLIHLHGCFHTPFLEILQQALTVVTEAYRPVGGLFYRSIYSLFGLDPLPFHAAAFALMGVNLLPAYRLVRILSGSRGAALTATFLLSCNASFVEMYHSTGTIYDILCFAFFVGAFHLYAASRSREKPLSRQRWICIFILYCCALGSKEMAAAFPAVLILYELFYHPHSFRPRDISAVLRKPHFRAIACIVVLTAAYSAVKLATGNPISINPVYSLAPSFGKFAASLNHYLPRWLYLEGIGELATLAIAAGAGIAAFALRAKALMFGVCFTLATMLPLAFIPPRGGFAFYLPSLGCALFLGASASLLSKKLFASRIFDRALPGASRLHKARAAAVFQGILFLILVTFLTPLHRERLQEIPGHYGHEQVRKIIAGLRAAQPNLPRGAKIYLADDSYVGEDFMLVSLTQLAYGDPTLWLCIDRNKKTGDPSPVSPYDFFFRRREGRIEPFAFSPPETAPAENIAQLHFQPAIGRPGEEVSVQMQQLAGKEIDVYWRQSFAGNRSDVFGFALKWCAVDAEGFCTVSLPKSFPRSRIEILYVRGAAAQGEWHTARGILNVR